jgi:cobalt/nickel transport protein
VTRTNSLLLAIALLLVISPIVILRRAPNEEAPFSGVDGQANAITKALKPSYRPWAFPLFTPPNHEIESLLFGLQASSGAAVMAFCFGYYRGKRARKESDA